MGIGRMKGYCINIEKVVKSNSDYRRVLYTTKRSQLVLMCLLPGEDIGNEIHISNDQFFLIEEGEGVCMINGENHCVKAGDAVMIPAGAKHNLINTDKSKALKVLTVYAPAQHKDGIIRKTKKEAMEKSISFDGVTTE